MDFGFPDLLNRSTTGRRLVAAGGVATRSAGDHSRLGDLSRVSRHGCVNATLPIFADISAVQPNKDHRGC